MQKAVSNPVSYLIFLFSFFRINILTEPSHLDFLKGKIQLEKEKISVHNVFDVFYKFADVFFNCFLIACVVVFLFGVDHFSMILYQVRVKRFKDVLRFTDVLTSLRTFTDVYGQCFGPFLIVQT